MVCSECFSIQYDLEKTFPCVIKCLMHKEIKLNQNSTQDCYFLQEDGLWRHLHILDSGPKEDFGLVTVIKVA